MSKREEGPVFIGQPVKILSRDGVTGTVTGFSRDGKWVNVEWTNTTRPPPHIQGKLVTCFTRGELVTLAPPAPEGM